MTIQEITKILQKHKTLSAEDYEAQYLNLQAEANSDSAENALKSNDLRHTAFFVLGANPKTIEQLTSIKTDNIRFNYFFCSFLLAKICQHTSFDATTLDNIANCIINVAPKKESHYTINSYGTQSNAKMLQTFSFDLGFTIGHCLSYGIDCQQLAKLYQPHLVSDDKLFINGLTAGMSPQSKGLMFNETYIKNVGKQWINDNTHKSSVIKTFQRFTQFNEVRHINSVNERMTWLLNIFLPQNKVVNQLHSEHTDLLKNMNEQQLHSPQFAAYFEQCLIQKGEQLTDQIEQKFQLKLEKEVARIEQKAIDNAHIILEEQKLIKETKEFEEKSLAFKQKLNKML